MCKKNPVYRPYGFSLVEVVLALGLSSFCLLAIIGLLPVGLRSFKNANEESAAANVLNQMASAIRNTTTTDGTNYIASSALADMSWQLDGSTNVFSHTLALSGQVDPSDARLQARVVVVAPTNSSSPGHAFISVAWPSSATWADGEWKKSEGSISSGILFVSPQ